MTEDGDCHRGVGGGEGGYLASKMTEDGDCHGGGGGGGWLPGQQDD